MSSLEKILRYTVLTGLFALPFIALYVSSSLFFPFISGKNFAFRIIVEIIAALWLSLAFLRAEYRPKRGWLLYAFALFTIVIGIADLHGVAPFKSIWSNFERMDGWITLVHLFVLFIVASAMLNSEKMWRHWWHTSLGVSVLVGIIGVFQLMGLVAINQSGVRIDARLGNSTYLGVYMLFHIFIAALFLARAWITEGPGRRMQPVMLYGGIIALDTIALFFTATRGAILGLLGGAGLSALLLIILSPRSRVAWRAGVVIVGLIVLTGGFWLVHNQAWVQKIEPLQRLATIQSDGVTEARLMNWKMAIKGFEEKPLLGWGQEEYAAVFDRHYDPNMYGQEPWFDRVHNIVLDWLIAGGILGLIGYLSLYMLALLALWRSGAFEAYERAILTGLLAGYFFYLIFTFDNILSYVLFSATLAYISVRASQAAATIVPEGAMSRTALPYAATASVLAAAFIVWSLNSTAIAQNKALIQAIQPHQEGVAKNLEYFKQATATQSIGTQEVREQLSQAAITIAGNAGVSDDLKRQFVQLAATQMQLQAQEAPLNARFPLFLGILYDHVGMYAEALTWLTKARELSPQKQSILFELGLNALARNQAEESLGYFKAAYDAAPAYREAQLYYISALIRAGKDAEAQALLVPLISADQAVDSRIASAYAARDQYSRIVAIWSAHIQKKPDDIDARFLLAGAQYAGGNAAAAIATLEEAKRLFPASASQADQLIQQVKNGVPVK